jgi:hypothetical protein
MLQCFWQVLFVGCGWVGACVVLCEFLLAGELSVLLADCWSVLGFFMVRVLRVLGLFWFVAVFVGGWCRQIWGYFV